MNTAKLDVIIHSGISPSENIDDLFKLVKVPLSLEFQLPTRLLNRCEIGADPEFVFENANGNRFDASSFGFKTGIPFGADNNGRLAEMRIAPARSALQLTANILKTLRWGALLLSQLTDPKSYANISWRAGAFRPQHGHDGIGGHIHFCRFRKEPIKEIRGLDNLMWTFRRLGVFPDSECMLRETQTQYGHVADVRRQPHGYEYRTFPSWLDNPWLTFFVLTLAKLLVIRQEKVATLIENDLYGRETFAALFATLGKYKGLDDDARLCVYLLRKYGLPRHAGVDFRTTWGLPLSRLTVEKEIPTVYPSVFPAASEFELRELFEHFVNGRMLGYQYPQVDWTPSKVASHFIWMLSLVNTYAQPMIGELAAKLCVHETLPVIIYGTTNDYFHVSAALQKVADMKRFRLICKELQIPDVGEIQNTRGDSEWSIGIPRRVRNNFVMFGKLFKLLTSGVFPIWEVGHEKDADLSKFKVKRQRKLWGVKTVSVRRALDLEEEAG